MTINNSLRTLLAILGVAFAGIIVFSLRDTSAKEGGSAPQFSVSTEQGKTITPVSFGGKVLVLNFWATWCPTCIEEIPSLDAFQKRFAKDGVVVVAVSVDKNEQKYKRFLSKVHVKFDTAWDPKADVSTSYGTFIFPETYIIKDGRIQRKFGNAENWVSDDMTQYVKGLL